MAEARDAAPIDDVVVAALVDVFSSWRQLERPQKQRLLKAFGIQLGIDRIGQGKASHVHVTHVRIGSLRNVVVYKEVKKLGIE